ncbi:MAG: hypothetical protein ACI8TQ_003918 [Planctomycetota bacterium]
MGNERDFSDAVNMKTRVLEDLDWLLSSPSLVTGESLQCTTIESLPSSAPEIEDLEQAILARQSSRFRLGAYFESLVTAYLNCAPGVSELRTNTVIRDEKRTLGEFDYLFRNEAGQTEHWEVAIKFYLYAPGANADPNLCFLGPRAVDRLDRKVQHMREHQLRLGFLPAALGAIASRDELQVKALMRGRLFYPLDMDWQTCNLSSMTTTDHLRGWWTRQHTTAGIPDADRYILVDKPDWLTCPSAPVDDRVHTLKSLANTFEAELAYPIQVVGIDESQQELHRGFVVPTDWPPIHASKGMARNG